MNEPWTFLACNAGISCVDAHGNLLWHEWDAGQDVAERVLASVNACAGMDDPAAQLEQLRAENARLREALVNMTHYAGYALDYLLGVAARQAASDIKEAEALIGKAGHE